MAAYGHFHPLVPLARAFGDAGHDVAFATSASFADRVASAGFELLPAGMDEDELERRHAPYRRQAREIPPDRRRPFAFTSRFALIEAPAKLAALRELVEAWEPDLLVHEAADLAAPIAAASAGVPRANHSFGRIIPRPCLERAAVETERLWNEAGLEAEPLCGSYAGPYVDICPPSFQSEPLPAGSRVQALRPLFPPPRDERPPAWLERLPDRPTVYVTLGTVHNDLAVFRVVLDALADLDCNVVATLGRDNDPTALEPVPSNATVERYVPQSFLLPRCSAVVAHGGSGSILATFAEGLPTLLVPQGADQFDNAGRCAALGAGRVLMPDDLTPEAVRDALLALLEEPSYRASAARLAAEIAALPPPEEVVPVLAAAAA